MLEWMSKASDHEIICLTQHVLIASELDDFCVMEMME